MSPVALFLCAGPALSPVERVGAPSVQLSRRALSLGLPAAVIQLHPGAAAALFESRTQQLLQTLAAAQPRVTGLVREVADFDRRRSKMPADYEDDAYVLRFTRSVLDPLVPSMVEVAKEAGGRLHLPPRPLRRAETLLQNGVALFTRLSNYLVIGCMA